VLLDVTDLPPIVRAELSGTISIPDAWHVTDPSLNAWLLTPTRSGTRPFNPVSLLEPLPGQAGTWRWTAGKIEVGRYALRLYEPPFLTTIDLEAHGLRDASIEVPPPVELSIRVVDERSGGPTDVETIQWAGPDPGGTWGAPGDHKTVDYDTGLFTLLVPRGSVTVSSFTGEEFDFEPVQIEARALRSEHTIRAQRVTAVILDILDGTEVIPFGDVWFDNVDIEPIGHAGKGYLKGPGRDGLELRFWTGGTYRIRLHDLDGFEPAAPFEVVVAPGEVIRRRIDLVREK
jgi:hypothetical protein